MPAWRQFLFHHRHTRLTKLIMRKLKAAPVIAPTKNPFKMKGQHYRFERLLNRVIIELAVQGSKRNI